MSPLTQTNETPAFRKTAETFAAGAKTLPQKYFVSPEVFQKEQMVLFSTQWVLVGHQSQIAKPGDYFVHDVADTSQAGKLISDITRRYVTDM